jgi:hypothetical protein
MSHGEQTEIVVASLIHRVEEAPYASSAAGRSTWRARTHGSPWEHDCARWCVQPWRREESPRFETYFIDPELCPTTAGDNEKRARMNSSDPGTLYRIAAFRRQITAPVSGIVVLACASARARVGSVGPLQLAEVGEQVAEALAAPRPVRPRGRRVPRLSAAAL